MNLSADSLQALRECCQDEAAFEQMQRVLAAAFSNGHQPGVTPSRVAVAPSATNGDGHQSEARYRAMLDASPDLMFRITREGKYLDFKPNNTANIPPEGIVGRTLWDVLPQTVADQCLATIHTTLQTGELQTYDYQLSEPTGPQAYEARVVVSGADEVLWIAQNVTQRKQAERAKHESELRNRALINVIPDLLFRLDHDGIYLDCKVEHWQDVTLTPHELIGKSIYEILPPALADQCMQHMQNALETNTIQSFEYQLGFDGKAYFMPGDRPLLSEQEAFAYPSIRDYEARVIVCGENEVLAIVRDITERKQAEADRRRSEEKFAKAFHASPNPMTLSTIQDGLVIEVNESFLEVAGYTRDEVIGQRVFNLNLWVNLADRDRVTRTLLATGTVKNLECDFYTKQGNIVSTLFSAEVLNLEGKPCMLSMVVDITESKQAQQQLWANAERARILRDIALRIRESLDLQEILDRTVAEVREFLQAERVNFGQLNPDGSATMIAESVVPEWPSMIGQVIDDPILLDESRIMFSAGQIRVANDTTADTEYPGLSRFYQQHHIKAGLAAPIFLDNQFFGVLCADQCSGTREWQEYEVELMRELATQVSIAIQQASLYKQVQELNAGLEQQVAERTAQLQQKMEELQELNQLKDEFLNAFSHDLKTPVMGMSLVIGNLLNQPGETIPVGRPILHRMMQSSNHQLQLINSLLQAHSSETRGVVLNYELIQLSLLLQIIVEDLEPLVQKNQAILENRVPIDLPLVKADPLQLRRVFENLITNGLHHNPPGVTLTLSAQVEADVIRLMLHDDGVGMAPEVCDRLFERYARGRQSRHRTGIGLGLYLCRQIVTAHGGEIGVISTPGQGSTFWLTLPLAISSRANTNPTASEDA